VHDTNGEKNKQSTKWREVCPPALKGVVGTIELEIDCDADVVFWKFEGKRFAESVITEYLKSKDWIAYLSLVHVNDIVSINAEPIHANNSISQPP